MFMWYNGFISYFDLRVSHDLELSNVHSVFFIKDRWGLLVMPGFTMIPCFGLFKTGTHHRKTCLKSAKKERNYYVRNTGLFSNDH